jgi:microcystin degradation protein MlrC
MAFQTNFQSPGPIKATPTTTATSLVLTLERKAPLGKTLLPLTLAISAQPSGTAANIAVQAVNGEIVGYTAAKAPIAAKVLIDGDDDATATYITVSNGGGGADVNKVVLTGPFGVILEGEWTLGS